MKKLFLISVACLLSGGASAQWNPPPGNPLPPTWHVFPQVRNYGYSAEVMVSNPNNYTVWCSGSLSMHMDGPENRIHTAMVSLNLFPRGYAQRSYRPNSPNRIRYVSHTIFCR